MISRVRSSAPGLDAYGDPIPGTETTEPITGAFIAPRQSSDINDPGRAGVIIGLTLFLPFGFDLRHDDDIDIDGTRYRIDGDPGDWYQPMTGWEAGATVALVRAEG